MNKKEELLSYKDYLLKIKKDMQLSNPDLVQIGDKVNLNLTFGDEETENCDFILTDKNVNLDNNEISTESPLGKLIHQKEIGFQGFYIVNNIKTDVVIINKTKANEEKTRS